MKLSKTREELVNMYIKSLEEGEIPWRKRWINENNINAITKAEYKGINQLMLNYVSYKEKYTDNRWMTYLQIKQNNLKLKNGKNKGVPIEFWTIYDIINKIKINMDEYYKILNESPDREKDFVIYSKCSYVFNGSLIEGLPEIHKTNNNIKSSNVIDKLIKNLKVNYEERGNKAFYSPDSDTVVIPDKNKFFDEYSYYATQLHELCHSTGSEKRLNRVFQTKDKEQYAKEELIAEISSSFLMQDLNIPSTAEHIDNHKAYVQSWISILKDRPNELFKAISESNKVCNYIKDNYKEKSKEQGR